MRSVFCANRFKDRLKVGQNLQEMLVFIHGTFFEILICVSVTILMFEHYDWLGEADRTSLYFSASFGFALAVYLLFVLYFSLVKSRGMALKGRAERET